MYDAQNKVESNSSRQRDGFKSSIALLPYSSSAMGGIATVVGVKRIDGGIPQEEWDGSMPLPGDIVRGVAPLAAAAVDEDERLGYAPARSRLELSGILERLGGRRSGTVWVKVQRGNAVLQLRARVTARRGRKLCRRFTVMAARDDRHVAVLGDLTLDRCAELQEMSRTVIDMDGGVPYMRKALDYDWKKKAGIYLPNRHSALVSSILFEPFPDEPNVEASTRRSMAWFSAAVSSGVPLVFVNIQTEQISSRKETSRPKQQSTKAVAEPVLGIRLWLLPGITEIPLLLIPEEGDTRFGLDIRRTEEGFICIHSVYRGSAAERAGLRDLFDEASSLGHLVVISRVEGRAITPSEASSEGHIKCCCQVSIKERLAAAIKDLEEVRLHIMGWPNREPSPAHSKINGPSVLLPPTNVRSDVSP